MKLTRKKLRQIIQEHVWINNKDNDTLNIRKDLSPKQRKSADDLFLDDPEMGKMLGGVRDIMGPERPTWNIDLDEPDWNVTDVPFYLDEILEDQYDDTSIDEIAHRLEDEYDVNEKFAHDMLIPIDDQGKQIQQNYTPIMNRKKYEFYLKRWLREQIAGDDRFELLPNGMVYRKDYPTEEDYY